MKNIQDIKLKRIQSWMIYVLIILNIIIFILLASNIFFRLDLTEGKKYSISKATVDLLGKIDNTLVIEYYYTDKSKDVKQIAQVIQYVEDILQEYESNSKGKINKVIKQLNYEKDQAILDQLQSLGIASVPLMQQGQAESKSILGLSGIVLRYKEQVSVLPQVLNDEGFEYNLDVEIKKLLGDSDGRLGIIMGSMDKTMEKDYALVKQYLDQENKGVEVINSGSNIPNDVTSLIILGGDTLSDYDIFKIDQFFMNGGTAFIANGGINIIIQQYGMFGIPSSSKLIDLLSHYGITINKNLIADNDSYNMVGQNQASYPVWPIIKSSNINKKNSIVKSLEAINVFWPASIDISDRIKTSTEILLSTTDKSWAQTADFQISPDAYKYPIPPQNPKSFNVACAFSGQVNSYYANKEVPKNEGGEGKFTGTIKTQGKTKLVVVTSEFMMMNGYLQQDEMIFFLNSLDWMQKSNSLIQIRDKGKFSKPLDKAKNIEKVNRQNMIIFITTIIIPLLFIVLAFVINQLRYLRNKSLKEEILGIETSSKEGGK